MSAPRVWIDEAYFDTLLPESRRAWLRFRVSVVDPMRLGARAT